MTTLIDELRRIQSERGWSDRRMSRELGVSQAVFGHLKHGRMKAGRKVLRGVTRAFPWVDVKFFIAQDVDSKSQTVSLSLQTPPEPLGSAQERVAAGSEYSEDVREAPDGR